MRVVVDDGATSLTLDDEKKWRLAGELAKARMAHATKGVPPMLAPDCTISIQGDSWAEELEIYGRTVLRHRQTDDCWQFYFGIVVLEWLDEVP